MKPLMYGYLRTPGQVSTDGVEDAVAKLRRFAEAEGFCYATTFLESQAGSSAAFEELLDELVRAEARHVVVPTMEHLSSFKSPRHRMMMRLKLAAEAHVLTLECS
jgi:hypothetical protein